MRILWQGFTHPSETKPYNVELEAFLNEVADEGTTVEFRGVVPPDRHIHRMTEWRCAVQAISSAIRAEREGFDCVVHGHFQEPGMREMRAALSVPVLGLGECSMLYACQLGFRFGLVTIAPAFVAWHDEQVRGHGLEGRLAGIGAMQTSVELFVRCFAGDTDAQNEIVDQFVEHARPLVRAGAEVVIPAGGLPALLCARRGVTEVDGAAVLDPNLVTVKQAELAVRLRALNGVGQSRIGSYASPPPEAVEEFLRVVPHPEGASA